MNSDPAHFLTQVHEISQKFSDRVLPKTSKFFLLHHNCILTATYKKKRYYAIWSTQHAPVLCQVNFFTIKEAIMRAAWQKCPLGFDGAQIHLFPDLGRLTLYHRGLLKELREPPIPVDILSPCW